MFSFAMGALSAGSLGVADFIASQSSERIGAARALGGMLLVSSIVLTVVMATQSGFGPLMQPGALAGSALAALHGATMAIALLLFFHAMAIGQISIVAPIVATHPVIIVLFHISHGADFPALQIAAVAGILAGVGLVSGAGGNHGATSASGKHYAPLTKVVLVSLAASLAYGIAIILLQEASGQIGDLQVLWFGRVTGFLTVAIILLISRATISRLSPKWLLLFTVHGLLDSGGLLFILLGSVGGTGSAVTAVVASAFPVITLGLATLFLKERLNRWQILGATMVFVGVALLVGSAEA